ncbi:MAG: TonB-dependent receptor [Gemmatimonadetes bacterium]|nr:TonB-dependent receptor [Gemmatimonadota bacterium]
MKCICGNKPATQVLRFVAIFCFMATFLVFTVQRTVAQEASEETAASEEQSTSTEQQLPELPIVLDEELESMTVVGARTQPRTITESTVPIDVIQVEEFIQQGGSDLADLMRNVVPSYNVNTQPISDAGTIVRPANLRSLAPDQVLVLVNGKRRHRGAVINWYANAVAEGAQGPDLAAIPSIALERVEVLRDGASAQYGSDAIAGVLNFQLKDNYDGFSLETKVGSFQDGSGRFLGDGELFLIAGNVGVGHEDAWLSLSAEYGNSSESVRSVQTASGRALIAAGNLEIANPETFWGQPFVRDDLKIFANYGAAIGDNLEFFGHANYASKEVDGGFYFRNPHTRGGVYQGPVVTIDGVDRATLLVGDLDGLGQGSECAPVPIINDRPDQEAWLRVRDDPNCFSFLKMFPGGFTPRFGAFASDESVVLGLRGRAATLLRWELSAAYGRNEADYFIYNTVNASMGPDTPTYFDPGSYVQSEVNLNFDMTYPVGNNLVLAAGLERRTETFELVEGQIESYLIGQPLASQGFTPATNGFAGFSKVAAGEWDRSNNAIYLEGGLTPTDRWLLDLAVRAEDFEDFGTTTNYKVATNFSLTDEVKLRGSASTGFRAPTPGQQNAFNITTEFDLELNDLVNNGTVPSNSRAAELKGGKPLDAEKSVNISAGLVFDLGTVSATIDYFDIRVRDRLTVSQNFELTDEERAQLIAEGITSAAGLQGFQFFTNDFDSANRGIDVVVSAPVGTGTMSLAYNYTSSEVTDHNPEILDATQIKALEEGLPRQRGNLTLTQSLADNWNALGRASYYGTWYDFRDGETYDGRVLVDLESTIRFNDDRSRITIGAQNILNTYPDENPHAAGGPSGGPGNKYSQYSPFGFSGAFWYVKYGFSL